MRTINALLMNEIKQERSWYLGWIIGLNLYFILIILIYPGKEGMASFLDLLDEDIFKAILGEIGTESPGFTLWIGLMIGMQTILFFIFALLTGVRIVTKRIDNKTGELIYTLPVDKKLLIFYQLIVAFIFFVILDIAWIIPIILYPENVPIDRLLNVAWWSLIYMIAVSILGIFIGIISGSTDRSQQISFLMIMALYVLQIITQFQDNLSWIDKFNVLNWYNPVSVMLKNDIDWNMIVKLLILIVTIGIADLYLFDKVDLIPNRSIMVKIPKLSNRLQKPASKNTNNGLTDNIDLEIVKSPKSVQNSFYTFWIKPLKSKFPYTADFIYSERKVLLILFWSIVLIWPMQLLFYPGDTDTLKLASGFSGNPIMKLVTYNHNLFNDGPWLWYLVTQSVGTHWMIMIPLIFYWIKKFVNGDGETETGEIIGVNPYTSTRVIFERLLAIILELIWMISWMVFWLIISEISVNRSYDLFWEIVAIISLFPLYYFLFTFLVSIAFLIGRNGIKISRIILFIIFVQFTIAILNDKLNYWFLRGVFGLYNPVSIIRDKSIFVENSGVLILSVISLLSTFFLYSTCKKFKWLEINY